MAETVEDVLTGLLSLLTGSGGTSGGGMTLLDAGIRSVSGPSGANRTIETLDAVGSLIGGYSRSSVESLFPLVGLFRAIGGADRTPAAAYDRFELPDPVSTTLGYSAAEGNVTAIDFGARQTIRPLTPPATPQVTLNVNAMDSRSILDRSEEIADAVRAALLNSHSLGEVFWED
jgi:hypothetical protein